MQTKRIAVFCGSAIGSDPAYVEVATRLGTALAAAGLGLVYGGGGSGLMGAVARAALKLGGHVTGIMPASLVSTEHALHDVGEYYEVDTFHERKMRMAHLSDAFIILPGGPGTLEELIEQLAWVEQGYHDKPIIIVNCNRYWDPLLALLQHIQSKPAYTVVCGPEEAVQLFVNYVRTHIQPA